MLKKLRLKRAKRREEMLYRYRAVEMGMYLQSQTLNSKRSGIGNIKDHEIVVSLTSFPARINDVYLTIESLFQQSLQADRVILWLSEENFPNGERDLPEILLKQKERGLEIEFVSGDLGPYKKIIYSLERFPQALIITFDDDVLYPVDAIDLLYRAYIKQPDVIHCHRGHRMLHSTSGSLQSYQNWEMSIQTSSAAYDIFPTGIGGVLYFPGALDERVFDRETFQALAPNGDDIWLKAMSLKKGVPCKPVEDERPWKSRLLMIEGSQEVSLTKENKSKSKGNDSKIEAVFNHFQLWDQLKAPYGK